MEQIANPEQDTNKLSIPKGKHSFLCGGTTFIVDEKYEFIRQIGQGAYGVVCSARNRENSKQVAIKKITNVFVDLVEAKRILKDLKLMRFFDHENVIDLVEIIQPDTETEFDEIYIVTEFMETDLHRVIYARQLGTYK